MTSIQSPKVADTQIAAAAVEAMKSHIGENIERIAERVTDALPAVSHQQAVQSINRSWTTITAQAGQGPFSFKKFEAPASDGRRVDIRGTVVGLQLAGTKSADQLISQRRLKAAGTIDARQKEVSKDGDKVAVHGPQYWELMNHTSPLERTGWKRWVTKVVGYIGLDGAFEHLGYNLTRMRIQRQWSLGAKEKALRGISGDEIESLTKVGPNGEAPIMRPGDALLCGGGGDGGLTHAILYAGIAPANHPQAGAPMIIHAMATLKEGAETTEWIRDKLEKIGHNLRSDIGLEDNRFDEQTGVLYERLGNFFNRYHRDSIMIVRDSTLTPEQNELGISHARKLAGYDEVSGTYDLSKRVKYDYKLAPDNLVQLPQSGDAHGTAEYLAKYCTEVWLASNYVAHGGKRAELPYVGTAHYSQGSPLGTFGVHETFISEPEDLAISPDLDVVLVAGGGERALAEALRLRVKASIASMPRGERPIPAPVPENA